MKIAILGGGITGLTAAYDLVKRNHEVCLFEKEVVLGGLASGFKPVGSHWRWPLERTYHHLFASDDDILNFARDTGFNKIFFNEPITASLYEKSETNHSLMSKRILETYPLDTPFDLLRFPLLSPAQKIRTGAVLAFLKLSPFLSIYENHTAATFLKKTMSSKVWDRLWQELFRKKFGKYAGNILASFIWARIKKRTKKLGYINGGFQTFIDYLEKKNKELGVVIRKGETIGDISMKENQFQIGGDKFDAVISTLPTAVMIKITQNIFPERYLQQFSKLNYLHAVNLIIESKKPLLNKTYWLNVCSDKLPIMVLVQHTNFIDKKNYGDNHILYVGNYVDRSNELLKMDKEGVFQYFRPYLQEINPDYSLKSVNCYLFKAPFAQPIFDKNFVKNKPGFITPAKNFFIANLDMTYPYDRGTNFAVRLGREVAGRLTR